MSDLNRVTMMGRLARPVELKYTQSGTAIGKSAIAVNVWDGTEEKGHFFNITVWGMTAERMAEYVGKGQRVAIEGSMRQNIWEKDGVKHYDVFINVQQFYFADSKKDGDAQPAAAPASSFEQEAPPETEVVDPFLSDLDDDEIPF